MLENLQKRWWLFTIRGTLAILFGLAALLSPMVVIISLLTFFSFFAVLSGFVIVTLAFLGELANRWLRLTQGLIFIATGALVLLNPISAVGGLMILIAAWAIVGGLLDIINAISLRKVITNEWFMLFNGVISILFGIILAANLIKGAAVIAILFGIYALLSGIVTVILSIKIKNLNP